MSKRSNEVDLLRFLAALSVVLFHFLYLGRSVTHAGELYPTLSECAKYGFFGVPLFFIISGFVIMMSASQGTVTEFVASRAARLYPAFWVCCTATFLFQLCTSQPTVTVVQYLRNMTLVGTTGVPSSGLVDPSYWTLSFEIRFYAMVAVVLAFRQISRMETLLSVWLMLSAVAAAFPSKVLEIVFITRWSTYFIAGATLFFVWAGGMNARRAIMVTVCFALAEFQAQALARSLANDGVVLNRFGVSIAVACCVGVMVLVSLRATGPFRHRNWLAVGALTYPLYLLHQIVGLSIFKLTGDLVNRQVLLWAITLVMIGLAWIVNTQIEVRYAKAVRNGVTSTLRMASARIFRAGDVVRPPG
jgi:peptidoglycan/LPS O-acetylase OafA/YrhL